MTMRSVNAEIAALRQTLEEMRRGMADLQARLLALESRPWQTKPYSRQSRGTKP
jgi:uncharacterized coiled-coil protein SlyX